MHPRHAAFALLRRIALRELEVPVAPVYRRTWATQRTRTFHSSRRCFQEAASNANSQVPASRNGNGRENGGLGSADKPAYDITFTCKPCSTRSTHRISKQAYHYGSVLITCPECKNRHVISDHLKIFIDKATTIEDLMRDKGQLVKKGSLSEDGDLEFWDDGSTTKGVGRSE